MTMNALKALQQNWLMTPGPTEIASEVRFALSQSYTNPDLDPAFLDFYSETAEAFNAYVGNTGGETFLLTGEGILGLEAACASFIEPGDGVLVIENGIFGEGFNDFAKMYGAKTTVFSGDRHSALDPEAIEAFIEAKGPFKYATLVHCETPSGISNPVKAIGELLNRRGIISIVDAVSAIGGEAMSMEAYGLDVVLCASQKAFSAPVGITTVSLSPRALAILKARKTAIPGFYTNLKSWLGYKDEKWFPYTQPIHLLAAFRVALDQMDPKRDVERHQRVAVALRQALSSAGLKLYAHSGHANTVTTVLLPQGVDFEDLQLALSETAGILVGGGFGFLSNQIFRIGHMGEGADVIKLKRLLSALDQCFMQLGCSLEDSLVKSFVNFL